MGVKKHHVKKVQIFWPDVNTVGPDIDIFPISNGVSLNWVSPNKQTFCIKIIFILAGSDCLFTIKLCAVMQCSAVPTFKWILYCRGQDVRLIQAIIYYFSTSGRCIVGSPNVCSTKQIEYDLPLCCHQLSMFNVYFTFCRNGIRNFAVMPTIVDVL